MSHQKPPRQRPSLAFEALDGAELRVAPTTASHPCPPERRPHSNQIRSMEKGRLLGHARRDKQPTNSSPQCALRSAQPSRPYTTLWSILGNEHMLEGVVLSSIASHSRTFTVPCTAGVIRSSGLSTCRKKGLHQRTRLSYSALIDCLTPRT